MNSSTVVPAPKTADCSPSRVTKGLKTVGGNMSAANLGLMVQGDRRDQYLFVPSTCLSNDFCWSCICPHTF